MPEPVLTTGRPGTWHRRLAAAALLLAAAGGLAGVAADPSRARAFWTAIKTAVVRVPVATPALSKPALPTDHPYRDGLVVLEGHMREAMGIATSPVVPQVEPIRLELLGTTEYDSDNLTKIRPLFQGRVEKVYTTVGKIVSKGDKLIDLYSTELAEAKGAYEIKRVQWLFDKRLVDIREPLAKSHSIAQQVFLETCNDEMKSRREYAVSRDKLLVFGLNEAEVGRIEDEDPSQKARMTIRSPSGGIVIARDVVVGNLYDEDDTLLTIAPLDHLWVWGNVFESDLDLVRIGQSWEIQFPFMTEKLQGRVEYISNRVDPGTHAVRVRTSIPNREGRLKSDMLVRGMLAIPPTPGWLVIPRTALIVADGRYYVFLRAAAGADVFERRSVWLAQEKDDHVVVERGIRAGDEVVSVGGLLLNQLYEDRKMVRTGAPRDLGPGGDDR
jgi:cobalt-zinc-cadmium efflux system membrane fusion protein